MHADFFPWLNHSKPLLEEFSQEAELKSIPKGTVILHPGDYVKIIPFLVSGLVKVYKEEPNGKEILLYYIKPGESCIMSITTFMKNDKSVVKAVIEEDADIYVLSGPNFEKLAKDHKPMNEFVYGLFRDKYTELVDFIELISFTKQEERLLKYLQKEAKLKNSDTLQLTHQNIADDLGSSREVISRLLKKLQDRDLIIQKHGIISLQ